eukprot:15483104-Alexandrium_andersonii.AAC.1
MASSLSDLRMTSPVIPKFRMPRSAISAAATSSAPFAGTTQQRTARPWRCLITSSVVSWSSSRRRQNA